MCCSTCLWLFSSTECLSRYSIILKIIFYIFFTSKDEIDLFLNQVAEEINEAATAVLNSPHNDGPPASPSDNDRQLHNVATELIAGGSAIIVSDDIESAAQLQEKNTYAASIERQNSVNVIKLKMEPAHKNYDTIPSQYDPKSNIERGKMFSTS